MIVFFPENMVWRFMQTVSMHEMSNIIWKKKKKILEKYFKVLFAKLFTQHAKHYINPYPAE